MALMCEEVDEAMAHLKPALVIFAEIGTEAGTLQVEVIQV